MISKQKIKLVASLKNKKFRDELGLFVAEGGKNVLDLIKKFRCEMLFSTENWLGTSYAKFYFAELAQNNDFVSAQTFSVKTSDDLKPVSFLTTPQDVVAIFQKPDFKPVTIKNLKRNLVLALDGLQNTGNLGTIIRIADWFGIAKIVCSLDTADIFNPKTVQAAMGALANVDFFYANLPEFLQQAQEANIQIFGTFLDGKNIYTEALPKNGIIVLGNEGNGITPAVEKLIDNRLHIPNFSYNSQKSESLNVAIAAAVVCSEFRRRID
ncbi:MAG: RNA methyltransferase [Prevotellaceae bacterium]|jgi:TrmH family RNA methyltransferase|nr:RNA methyltransferase [Prevotellaceae bacterium]